MKKRIQDYITNNLSMLAKCRNTLSSIGVVSPVDAYDLLHVGVDRAASLLDLAQKAYLKGFIDRTLLMEAVAIANAWVAFDDEVLELIASAVPVPEAPVASIAPH